MNNLVQVLKICPGHRSLLITYIGVVGVFCLKLAQLYKWTSENAYQLTSFEFRGSFRHDCLQDSSIDRIISNSSVIMSNLAIQQPTLIETCL